MGFLANSSTVVSRPRADDRFSRGSSPGHDAWFQADGWVDSLSRAGVGVSPELALTLSHVYSAVDILSGDFGTCPCGLYEDLDDDGRRRVKFSDPGIGGLAYRLRWQPNVWQTAKGFWSTLSWQYQLRPACYAEIVYRPGSDTIIDQLVPRHPDRVQQIRLASGGVSFKLTEPSGPPRFLTQAEMFCVRNTSTDGLNALGRIDYGAKTIQTASALLDFTRVFFKKGITGALLATYKGQDMGDDEEAALHKSITRYVGGVENAGGVLLVPEDIDVKALGVNPEQAQLLGLKDLSGRDVARMFKIPPYKLAIAGTQTYASQVQSAQDYVTTGQMPQVREFQDAIYVQLIVARHFYAKFNTSHLLQADQKTRMEAHEIAIRARVIRPSEARMMEDMSPDPELDRLSALDHRAGSSKDGAANRGTGEQAVGRGHTVRAVLAIHDQAVRVIRRERVALSKIAKKYPAVEQGEAWQAELRTFYEDHAQFVAETMRLPMTIARAYAAQHGTVVAERGVDVMSDHWERLEAEDLVCLSLEPESIGRMLTARPEGAQHV